MNLVLFIIGNYSLFFGSGKKKMKKVMVPAEMEQSEIQIKKSKFISMIYPVDTDFEVKTILKKLRHDHPGSNHIVWSYVLGDSGTLYGLSDDGEPHGTAGRPVLEVLKGSGLTYAAVFVIRYFGGIKLGTGGLVSAYTASAQSVLSLVKAVEKVDYSGFHIICSYSTYEGIKNVLQNCKAIDIQENFAESVTFSGRIPKVSIPRGSDEIRELTNGRVSLDVEKE